MDSSCFSCSILQPHTHTYTNHQLKEYIFSTPWFFKTVAQKQWREFLNEFLLFLCSLSCVYSGFRSRFSPMISALFNTKMKCLNGLARSLERSRSLMLTAANSVAASGFNESGPLKLSGDPLYPLRVCNEDRRYVSANGTLCILFSLITNTLWLSVYCCSKREHR